MSDKGWRVQVDKDFIINPIMTPGEKMLYLLLCTYAREDDTAFPSQKLMADELGVSERQVRNLLHSLVEKRIITWDRVKDFSVEYKSLNTYKLWPFPFYDPHIIVMTTNTHLIYSTI
jgi:hypothetical protein